MNEYEAITPREQAELQIVLLLSQKSDIETEPSYIANKAKELTNSIFRGRLVKSDLEQQ